MAASVPMRARDLHIKSVSARPWLFGGLATFQPALISAGETGSALLQFNGRAVAAAAVRGRKISIGFTLRLQTNRAGSDAARRSAGAASSTAEPKAWPGMRRGCTLRLPFAEARAFSLGVSSTSSRSTKVAAQHDAAMRGAGLIASPKPCAAALSLFLLLAASVCGRSASV
jgi:hypothetical protein